MGNPRTGIEKKCPACGALFYVQAHRAEQATFCSMKCLWRGRKAREKKHDIEMRCAECGDAYFVPPHRRDKTRFCSRECGGKLRAREVAANRAAFRALSPDGSKVCLSCREEKPFSAFWRRASSADGHRETCKLCGGQKSKKWKAENSEKVREIALSYNEKNRDRLKRQAADRYEANKPQFKARSKDWRQRNSEKLRDANRAKREKNAEAYRAARRQHYQENKARYKAQSVARQKHIKQATPAWADLDAIAAIYAEAERLTIETGILHHVDHFYPLRGKTMCGLHVEGNLRVIPMLDNLRKSNAEPDGIAASP